MSILNREPSEIIALVIVGILAFAYHEFAHAIVADRMGDPTPRSHGRISLNPIVHLDAFGIIMLVLAGFGWATTPVNPYRLRGNPRQSMAIVAVAGPLANVLMAILWAIPIRLNIVGYGYSTTVLPTLYQVIAMGVWINMILFAFNLLPIPPLDGFTILVGLLPAEMAYQLEPLRRYGTMILIAVIFFLPFLGLNIFGFILSPILNTVVPLLTGQPFL